MREPIRGARVCLLSSGLGRGGAEKQLGILATALVSRGAAVDVWSMIPFAGPDRPEIPGATVRSLEMSRSGLALGGALRFAAALRESRPDVLIGFNIPACLLARAAGAAAGVPAIVASLRSERAGGWARQRMLRWTEPLGSLTCTNSSIVASRLSARGVVRRPMRVVPNGIDLPALLPHAERARLRESLGVRAGEFLWLAAGRLETVKDYPSLIAAARGLRGASLPLQLRIAGAGPLQADLQTAIESAGLATHVALLGMRDDVSRLMQAADALVLSSAIEGLPNVVMEALAVGTPVVSTDVGGVRELVADGRTGLLAQPGNHQELAARMRQMMELGPDARAAMGRAGRADMAARFSTTAALDAWFALIHDLLDSRAALEAAAA